ncbi:hypothetical protein BV898_19603 [Hypsibius exemplaris]|uniref:Uncharacterized protein n=1 Tax=Hypsibius exemplaris TaxID=2072580 RepID=A0A9X6NJ93_HYPEX|nr:hypothetical protein BV898_19603 [Hypsibius exemplaris]
MSEEENCQFNETSRQAAQARLAETKARKRLEMEDLEFGSLADAASQEAKRSKMEANRQEPSKQGCLLGTETSRSGRYRNVHSCCAWSLVQLKAEQPENDAWMLSAESWNPVEKGEHIPRPMLVIASTETVTSNVGEAGNQQTAEDHHSDDMTGVLDGEENTTMMQLNRWAVDHRANPFC